MKILHTADWHLGAYVGPQCDNPIVRMFNTFQCLDVLLKTARTEQPDIILVTGDIFHQARVWGDRALAEVRSAAKYLKELSSIAPIAILYGTPNHDGEAQFQALGDILMGCDIIIFNVPKTATINTKSGPIQIAGIPGFDKGHFRAQFPGLSAEEENRVFSQELANIVAGLSAKVDPSVPSILMAHHTVVGAELDNGQHIFQANEVVLPSAVLDASAFDLVCLGHIHKAQWVKSVSRNSVLYSGSIDAFTFNDEGQDKGFFIHHVEGKKYIGSQFIKTPAREFVTFSWSPEYTADYVAGKLPNCHKELVRDSVVRVLYNCDSETEKALNKKKLEQDLYAVGAYYVSEIRPEKVTAAVNRERMHEKLTVEDCLIRYLKEKNFTIPEIVDAAYPIIEQAQASIPMGSTSGIFLPLEIEVRNYRSYAEEKFSFEDIYFAMVNGINGSGKSSLFMDAITDCLYEKTRENELTGWIRNGEKSGSISFMFRLGDDIYRVVRTRQRSGKGTLSLAKGMIYFADGYNGDEEVHKSGLIWEDLSFDRMTDTQQKIIDLLGMDCDTFQSCILIMQDQCGKFMEANKSERMAVLANLLGLGIYDDLLKITKEKLTEVNREIRTYKAEIENLENEVAWEENLHTDWQQAEVELKTAQNDLQENREKLNDLHSRIGAIEGYEEEINRLKLELYSCTESYTTKKNKRDDLQHRVEETKSFLQNEQGILDKCAELDKARLDLAALDGKLQLLNDKRNRHEKLGTDYIETVKILQDLTDKLWAIEDRLSEREQLQQTVDSLSDIEAKLEEYQEKEKLFRGLEEKWRQKHSEYTEEEYCAKNLETIYSNQLEKFKKEASMLDDSECIDIENAKCKFLASAKAAKTQISNIENTLKEARARWEARKAELEKQLEEIDLEIGQLNYNLGEHSNLNEKVKTDHAAKDKLAKLAADAATYDQLKLQEAEYQKKANEIQDELGTLSKEITALENETGKAAELRDRIEKLASYEKMKEELPKAKQFMESTGEIITQLSADIDELNKRINEINARINDLVVLTVDKGRLHAKKQEIEDQIRKIEFHISHLNQRIGTISAELKSIAGKKEQLKEKQEQLKNSANQAANLEILAEAFGQDGIPYQIIRDIVPELEATANEILSQMTGGRMRLEFITEKTLKSNRAKEVATLDIIINDVDHGILPYLSRSGGQKVRAALAVSFALAMIKASRVGLQLGMMFVDEPPFLDAEGAEAYCAALAAIHERYPEMRILAISHDENMKTAFPQQIYVELTDQGSKVRRSV